MNGMSAPGGRRAGLIGPVLLWGSVWGIGEATLGHLLHLARVPGLPGLVMASFAVWAMARVAAGTRRNAAGAVMLTGVVAASFKLLDLLAPGTDLAAVANPVQAILLEALAGACWVALEKARNNGDVSVLPAFMKTGKIETSPFRE
jgi:hypothetical protein